MLQRFDRELTAAEREKIARQIAELETKLRGGFRSMRLPSVFFGILWLWTVVALLLDDKHLASLPVFWILTTLFWLVVGALISVPVAWQINRELKSNLRSWRAVLDKNRADVVRVQSSEVVEIGRVIKIGFQWPIYAFQLPNDEIALFEGSMSTLRSSFPNSDFSITHFLDETGRLMDTVLQNDGRKLEPQRVIHIRRFAADKKAMLSGKWSCIVIKGRLDQAEKLLGA